MKVFISWSGPRSKMVAKGLHGWLPLIIQSLKPWMSAEDIKAGARWSREVAEELSETQLGIICVTPENQTAPWLLFEAGALAKTLANTTYVCPYLIGLTPSQVQDGPLAQFQAKQATKQETLDLIRTINDALKESLPKDRLEQTFERFWPDLEQAIHDIPEPEQHHEAKRSADDMLGDLLEGMRRIERSITEGVPLRGVVSMKVLNTEQALSSMLTGMPVITGPPTLAELYPTGFSPGGTVQVNFPTPAKDDSSSYE